MRMKYITKPKLIDYLRYLDKNKILRPFRIKYSSFRSKKDMISDIGKYYCITENFQHYVFTLRPEYQFLVAPQEYRFSKEDFHFLDSHLNPLDLLSRPAPPQFHIRRGPFLVGI